MTGKHEQDTSTLLKEEAPASPATPAASAISSTPAAPVISWERTAKRPSHGNCNVIPFDANRRQSGSETEATVNVREITSAQGENEEPVRLIVISSGFGQNLPVHRHTVQSKAAA